MSASVAPVGFVENRLVDRNERRRIIPYSNVHYERLENAGQVPQKIRIGAARVAWSYRELMTWVAARKAERDAATSSSSSAPPPIAESRRLVVPGADDLDRRPEGGARRRRQLSGGGAADSSPASQA